MYQCQAPPTVVIEFEVEARPRVRINASSESEQGRVLDWINSHEEFVDLVSRALALASEEQTA